MNNEKEYDALAYIAENSLPSNQTAARVGDRLQMTLLVRGYIELDKDKSVCLTASGKSRLTELKEEATRECL